MPPSRLPSARAGVWLNAVRHRVGDTVSSGAQRVQRAACARGMIVHGLRATGCPERTGREGAHVRRELARGEGAVGRGDRGQAGRARDSAGCRGRGRRGGRAPRVPRRRRAGGPAGARLSGTRVRPAPGGAGAPPPPRVTRRLPRPRSRTSSATPTRPRSRTRRSGRGRSRMRAEQRRAVAFLVRRGFSTSVAWQVVGARSRR